MEWGTRADWGLQQVRLHMKKRSSVFQKSHLLVRPSASVDELPMNAIGAEPVHDGDLAIRIMLDGQLPLPGRGTNFYEASLRDRTNRSRSAIAISRRESGFVPSTTSTTAPTRCLGTVRVYDQGGTICSRDDRVG